METSAIQKTIEFIECNLKTDLSPDALAKDAGYSTYHFQRLFSTHAGMPISAYILSRRLENALVEIARGYRAVDVVLEYGFDTYPGFYKAFIREYGCSPKKYIAIYGIPVNKIKQVEVKAMSITRNQIKNLLKKWNIDQSVEIHDVQYMNGAKTANDVWRIGEDYFLRVGADRVRQIKNIAVAKALNGQGLASALPVLTKKGEEFLDGETLTVLTKRVKGTPYEYLDSFGDNALKYANGCGRAIARLHKALKAIDQDVAVDESDLYKTVVEWAMPNVQKQNAQWSMRVADSVFCDYVDTFGRLQAKLPRQIIHRDPNPSNILFCGDAVSGFIDFDLSERNVRLFDPCYCATGVLSLAESDEDYEKWMGVAAHILRAYDEENRLYEEEKQSIFYVMCSIQMICVAYFNGIDKPEYKQLAQTSRKMLQHIVANKDRVGNIFS